MRAGEVLSGARRVELAVLAIVLIAVIAAAWLLNWVASNAGTVDDEARATAQVAGTISVKTDAVNRLYTTNQLAERIAAAAKPLSGQLQQTVTLANGVDAKVRSANSSADGIKQSAVKIEQSATDVNRLAAQILGTATTVSASATNINTDVASILAVARLIQQDVRQIDLNLDGTVQLARGIHSDTGNLVTSARTARHESACIDREVHGTRSATTYCSG